MKNETEPIDMENITVMDYPNVQGYNVRFRRERTRISKFFSLGRYGSWQAALEAARQYRDRIKKDWRDRVKLPDRKIQYQTTNTGITAISKSIEYGQVVLQFNYTDEDGRHRNKRYRVGSADDPDYKQLYEKTMKQAIRERNRTNTRIYGVRWVNYITQKEGQYL